MKLNIKGIYPREVLKPVEKALRNKLDELMKRKQRESTRDPYADKSRLDDNAAIDADAAETVGHMEVSAVQKMLNYSIIRVRKALTMIKIGTYGVCEKCGKMIDTDRLVIMPETTLCVDCEKKREK